MIRQGVWEIRRHGDGENGRIFRTHDKMQIAECRRQV
jgi:hypothetical protein